MSDTYVWITPGWGPSHPRWRFDAGTTRKMQAREHGSVGRHVRRHRFDSMGRTPVHLLAERDDRRRLREALEEVES